MSKYQVNCSDCGTEFERVLFGSQKNRNWKLDQPQTCKSCWISRQRKIEITTPVTAEIRVDIDGKIEITLTGNTQSKKEEIKALGYFWGTSHAGATNLLSMSIPKKGWIKLIALAEIENEIKSLSGIVEEIDNQINPLDLGVARESIQLNQKKDELIAVLGPAPARPGCHPSNKGEWNFKIYSGNRVYIDNQEVHLSNEEVILINDYSIRKRDWLRRVEEIKNLKEVPA